MIALWLSRLSEATLAWSNGALNSQSDGEELANSTDYHQSADSQIHEAAGRDTQPRLAIDAQSRFASAMLCAPTTSIRKSWLTRYWKDPWQAVPRI
jgi:hypothetical protein